MNRIDRITRGARLREHMNLRNELIESSQVGEF
jgi:hypothetical protein